jgi:hypothetical protein
VTEETRSTGPTSRRHPVWAQGRRPYPFRGFCRPLSRGGARRPYGSGRHSVTELTPALPHCSPTVPGLASRGGLAEQRRGYDSQAVSEGRRGEDSPLTPGARGVSEHLMLRSGEWARGLWTRETLERGGDSLDVGRVALKRGGDPPEGARSPRARRKFARGGA